MASTTSMGKRVGFAAFVSVALVERSEDDDDDDDDDDETNVRLAKGGANAMASKHCLQETSTH